MNKDNSIKLDCQCIGRCSILCIDFDDYGQENTWIWDFYTNSGYERSWSHRLKIAWNVIRGKEHYFNGTVHGIDEMRKLYLFLHKTLKYNEIQNPKF